MSQAGDLAQAAGKVLPWHNLELSCLTSWGTALKSEPQVTTLSCMTTPLAIFTEAWPIAWQRICAVLSKTTTEDTLTAGLTNSVGETATVTALMKRVSKGFCAPRTGRK